MESASLRSKAASLKIVFCLMCFAVIAFGNIKKIQAASVNPNAPCDSLYLETLSSRAWLEAQREITQNQNIILRPDSVIEYTCFNMFLRELSDHASGLISEQGGNGIPANATAMDNILERLVGDAMREYITQNFSQHFMLGGHQAGFPIDHFPLSVSAGTYNCDKMNLVWQAAKCINLVRNTDTDGFYTFQEYATDAVDKRRLPFAACGSINTTWTENITFGLGTGPWTGDLLVTYLDQTTPDAGCSGTPIPTGINVSRSSGTPTNYQEKICLQPGCRYDPATDDCIDN